MNSYCVLLEPFISFRRGLCILLFRSIRMSRCESDAVALFFQRVARIPLLYTICCQSSSICKEREKTKITVKEINCKSFLYVLQHYSIYYIHTYSNIIVLYVCIICTTYTYNTYFIYYLQLQTPESRLLGTTTHPC